MKSIKITITTILTMFILLIATTSYVEAKDIDRYYITVALVDSGEVVYYQNSADGYRGYLRKLFGESKFQDGVFVYYGGYIYHPNHYPLPAPSRYSEDK